MFRKTLIALPALALGLALAPGAHAQTTEDRLDIVELTARLDTSVDAKQWDTARALFVDTIEVEMGGPAETMPADELIASWSRNLYEGKPSFHLRGNHIIDFSSPTRAVVRSKGYAWNRVNAGLPDGDLWEVWGDYTFDVRKVDGEWMLGSFVFALRNSRGNGNVPGYVPEQ